MEIKITTKQTLQVLYVLAWIIFIGVCIDAGGTISNAVYTLVFNPNGASSFWQGIDLSSLYNFDQGYFFVQTFLMSIAGIFKAIMFYLIVRILHNKKLDMAKPFNAEVGHFILMVAYLSVATGIFSRAAAKYAVWLSEQDVKMPNVEQLRIDGADVWLFMGITLFVIAQIFKRGIEIQSEHELTV